MTHTHHNEENVEEGVTAEEFAQYYNGNIPSSYPSATLGKLREFQAQYPSLFQENGLWYVDKHRKRFMDWLVSHR